MFDVGCDTEGLRDVLWNLAALSPEASPPRSNRAGRDRQPPQPSSPSRPDRQEIDGALRSEVNMSNAADQQCTEDGEDDGTLASGHDDEDDIIECSQHESFQSNRKSFIKSFYEYPTLADRTLDSETDYDEVLQGRLQSEPGDDTKTVLESQAKGPSRKVIVDSCLSLNIPERRYDSAFCSKKDDVPRKGIELGRQKIQLPWELDLPTFQSEVVDKPPLQYHNVQGDDACFGFPTSSITERFIVFESVIKAPTRADILRSFQSAGKTQTDGEDRLKVTAYDDANEDVPLDHQDDAADLPHRQSQVVYRVRRDSNDSVGSELSLSSDEDKEEKSRMGFTVVKNKTTDNALNGGENNAGSMLKMVKRKSDSFQEQKGDHPDPVIFKRRRISFELNYDEGEDSGTDLLVDEEFFDFSQKQTDNVEPDTGKSSEESTKSFLAPTMVYGRRDPFMSRMGAKRSSVSSPIEGATPTNSHAFKLSLQNLQEARAMHEHQYVTLMSMEVHVPTRQKLLPDPEYDAVGAIFFFVRNDVPADGAKPQRIEGIMILDANSKDAESDVRDFLRQSAVYRGNVRFFADETELIMAFVRTVSDYDPDILVGYEVQMASWGYLIERAAKLNINLAPMISRLPAMEKDSGMREETDQYGADHTSELKIAGRIVLNAWRVFRHEMSCYSYTFENMMFHILHERVPKFEFCTLTAWWCHPSAVFRWRVVEYYLIRVHGVINLLEQLDILGRTSELARLFGIQFYEVFSRGSQFRVESLMLRMAKSRNYVAVSPSIQQRASMRAPEYIPLVMEPESRFYVDPLLVLDFQSLYPSIIIAYNYCYSTCLGRVPNLGQSQAYDFGCTNLKISPERLHKLQGHLNFSPGGVAFLKSYVRLGILPQMLKEILETRLMVKKSMKLHKDDKTLQKVLHSRQLGLKLIANVTYGYTSANFSGRMPCMEVADSVVSKGRETLERAVKMIEQTDKWRAKVVYGDTDSVFVLLPGRSRDEAFKIGEEIADTVTQDNPKPVKLKFEKVYHPCILQTKKRYVGYMYESVDQEEPTYDAKGIETVRRDGCPAVAKILEKSLRVLFETKDVSKVKMFVQRQFRKIMQNRASVQDLTFAKEFRGIEGYRKSAVVPALEITKRLSRVDRRCIPRTGERVPYVIVFGEPGRPLIQSVRTPKELLADSNMRPNSHYYITKAIVPPLNRCFSLVGADALAWYLELPRVTISRLQPTTNDRPRAGPSSYRGFRNMNVISKYFASHHCACCGGVARSQICESCRADPQRCALTLTEKLHRWDKAFYDVRAICNSCTLFEDQADACLSLDCPVLYKRKMTTADAEQIDEAVKLLNSIVI